MLTALRIENYKAFAKPQRISAWLCDSRRQARPLTLIYVPNSPGKSNYGPHEKQERLSIRNDFSSVPRIPCLKK